MDLTGNQLISHALRDIGVLGVGRSLQPADANLGLVYVQEILDSWAADGLVPYHTTPANYTLTANQQSRTIGPTGNFVQVRPVFIEIVTVTPVGLDFEQQMEKWDRERWQLEPLKTLTDEYPLAWYYDPTYPDGTLYFWPTPTTPATVTVWSKTAITGFANLTTTYSFPPGYGEALRTELVVRLSRPFGRAVTPDMLSSAAFALATVKRLNLDQQPREARCDDAIVLAEGRAFDYRIGE